MPKNWFHTLYTAIGVFVSVFLVAIYARPATAMPPLRAPTTNVVHEETIVVVYKYLAVDPKPTSSIDVIEKK